MQKPTFFYTINETGRKETPLNTISRLSVRCCNLLFNLVRRLVKLLGMLLTIEVFRFNTSVDLLFQVNKMINTLQNASVRLTVSTIIPVI